MNLERGSDIAAAFRRLAEKSIEVGSLINIGSGRGDDIGFFRNTWPHMQSLMIDMDERFVPVWESLAGKNPGLKHIVCAAGSEDTAGYFSKSNDVGGALSAGGNAHSHPTPIRKIDSLVRDFDMPKPYFLKFDTHGVELDIIAGASETLKHTSLIMMEVYNFKLNFVGNKNLTFDEMSLHMKSLGFRCVDMCDPLFRPGDHALWQFHMIFIRDDHPVWRRNSYSAK